MNVLLFGESCTGKSSVASELETKMDMKVYSGKDYLRLAKNPNDALVLFKDLLRNSEENIIFVSAEKEQVDIVPNEVIKILFTAELKTKKERFSIRFRGNLPKPVEQMLERKHGMFDNYDYDLHFAGGNNIDDVVDSIVDYIKDKKS